MRFVLDPLSPTGVSKETEKPGYRPYFAGGPGKPSLVDRVNGKTGDVQLNLDDLTDVVLGTPADNQALAYDSATEKFIPQSIASLAGGDVTGPASATDNAIARFDGTTGKLVQNSPVNLGDAGDFIAADNINLGFYAGNKSSGTGTTVSIYGGYTDDLVANGGDVNIVGGDNGDTSQRGYIKLSSGNAAGEYTKIDNSANTAERTITLPNANISLGGFPASSTDNAIARFDGATGKLIENSTVTINDAGGIATTIADTGNTVGLTITQNDTTNNPDAVNITNAGTGDGLEVTQTGLTAAGKATLLVSSNVASSSGNLVKFLEDNASATHVVMNIQNDGAGRGLFIDNNGNGIALDVDKDFSSSSTGTGVVIDVDNASTGGAIGLDISGVTATSGTVIGQRIALPSGGTANYALQLSDTTGVAAGGITFGTDANLYRIAANVLASDDSARVLGYIYAGSVSTPNNTTAGDISGTRLSLGNTALSVGTGQIARMDGTIVDTASGTRVGIGNVITLNPASASSSTFRSYTMSATVDTANAQTFNIIDSLYSEVRHMGSNNITTTSGLRTSGVFIGNGSNFNSAATIGSANGISITPVDVSLGAQTNTGIITVARGVNINNSAVASGPLVITTQIGIDIAALTSGGTDIGIRIAKADTYSLQLSDTGGTAAGGITFGTDVTLYRSAANVLKTDDSLIIVGRTQNSQGADVASANDLTLGADGNVFEITGTTQVNAITTTNWQNGSRITLLFTSTPTVKHNTAGGANTSVLLLAGAADFAATAGDTLTLVLCEIGGTVAWREVGRAVI